MPNTGAVRRWILKIAATRGGLWLFHIFVRLVDIPISRLTGGKFIPSAQGNVMPIYYLTTLGARSNQPRSGPVLCVPDDGNLILIGSNWGTPTNPSWVYNLRAHPRARITRGRLQKAVTGRELHGEERAECWRKAVQFYPLYPLYEQRSGRQLPVFLLEGEIPKSIQDS